MILMFVKEIEYVDFNGELRNEKFYFHLSLPEVTRIEAGVNNTLKDHIEELIVNNQTKDLLDFLELVILTSYGVKTNDGKTFEKSHELKKAFEYSPAYAEFFEALLTDPDLSKEFGEKVADNGRKQLSSVPSK